MICIYLIFVQTKQKKTILFSQLFTVVDWILILFFSIDRFLFCYSTLLTWTFSRSLKTFCENFCKLEQMHFVAHGKPSLRQSFFFLRKHWIGIANALIWSHIVELSLELTITVHGVRLPNGPAKVRVCCACSLIHRHRNRFALWVPFTWVTTYTQCNSPAPFHNRINAGEIVRNFHRMLNYYDHCHCTGHQIIGITLIWMMAMLRTTIGFFHF